MNHRFSHIGFFVFWLLMTVLMFGLVGLTFGNEERKKQLPEAGETALQTTASVTAAEDSFRLVEENGYVIVIDQQGMVYEYTDISLGHLPAALQDEIRQGKPMSSILEVYNFLENYSS